MDNNRGQNRGRGGRGQQRGGGRGRGGGGSAVDLAAQRSPSATGTISPSVSTSSASSFAPRGFSRGRGGSPSGGRDSPSGSSSAGSGFAPRGGRGGAPPGNRGGYGGAAPHRGGRGGPASIFNAGQPARPEDRLSSREQDALVARFRSLSAGGTDNTVVRPGFGKRGAAIMLRANFFALKYPKNVVLYDYAVTIKPSVKDEERRTRKRIFELLESTVEFAPFLHEVAHDRAQRVISRRLLPSPFVIEVPYTEEGGSTRNNKTYTVEIQEPKELRSADLDR